MSNAIDQLNAIVDAWEALPGGRQVRNRDVEQWLREDMSPAINAIRGFLQRPRPDGVIMPPPPGGPLARPYQHPDDIAVDHFAAAMKEKLAKKRSEGRGGWDDKSECSNVFLSALLWEHMNKGDPVDVGNLAMMLFCREERIASLLEVLQGE